MDSHRLLTPAAVLSTARTEVTTPCSVGASAFTVLPSLDEYRNEGHVEVVPVHNPLVQDLEPVALPKQVYHVQQPALHTDQGGTRHKQLCGGSG